MTQLIANKKRRGGVLEETRDGSQRTHSEER